jgi:hypothetical protein
MLQDFKFEEYGASRQCCSHGFHVLLFNLGGPETLNDVQPFLFNLFADSVSDRAI